MLLRIIKKNDLMKILNWLWDRTIWKKNLN